MTYKGQLVTPAKLRRALRIEKGTRVRFARIRGGIAVYPKQFGEIKRFRGIFADLAWPPDLEREPDGSLGETVSVTPDDAIRAPRLKAQYNLPYAHAFAAALTGHQHVLVTADREHFARVPKLRLLKLPRAKP